VGKSDDTLFKGRRALLMEAVLILAMLFLIVLLISITAWLILRRKN
jgi:sensor domain CHASE-containing protein